MHQSSTQTTNPLVGTAWAWAAYLSMEQSFVQAPEHRSKIVTEATGIPLIDVSPLISGEATTVDALWPPRWVRRAGSGPGLLPGRGPRRAERRSEAAPLGSRYYESEHTKNVRDCKEEEVFDLVAHEPPAAAAGAGADGEVAYVPEQVARGPAGLQVRIHLQPVY